MPDLPTRFAIPAALFAGRTDQDSTGDRTKDATAADPAAVPVRDAATVILLRDGGAGPEAFLLRRARQMAFAGGMTAFPGGALDRRDLDPVTRLAGPDPRWWAERFDCDVMLAMGLLAAAVRETFEESGVLLAGPDPTSVVADAAAYAGARAALVAGEVSLAEVLNAAGLVLRADLLRPWARWVTPVGERRRYDAWFLLAELPAGQHADGSTTEATEAGWQRPAGALADVVAGRRVLMPPTWHTLSELAAFDTVAAALAASGQRRIQRIEPRLVWVDGAPYVAMPGDPLYPEAAG